MYQIANVIASIFQAHYPGGLQSFRDEGGFMDILRGEPLQVLIYHPNLKEFPEEIKNILQGIAARTALDLRFTDFKLNISEENFAEMPHKLIEIFMRYNVHAVAMHISPLCVMITPMMAISAKDLDAVLKEISEKAPEITRIAIIRDSGRLTLYEMPPKTPSEQVVYLEDLPTRNKVITEEDITDLKITLANISTVEDFINSF